ncbi:MAG: glycosyltransferase, partial [Deltaproteobacteria bacterium]|nr:glycosyltransferase [Deltaproteobacteria bacterium]
MSTLKSTIDKILHSGVFDRAYYCAQIGRQLSVSEAVEDYVIRGETAGLTPNVLFCPAYVRRQLFLANLLSDGDLILLVYLNNPEAEINPHLLFDYQYYRMLTRDGSLDKTCLEDYVGRARLGDPTITPHVLFDCEYYRERYPDVVTRKVDPLRHYLRYGWTEGRQPHPLFVTAFWKANLTKQGIDPPDECPLTVYVSDPRTWLASPHPLFDATHYQAQLAKKALSPNPDRPLLVDMLLRADRVPCHPLFDCEFYELQATSQNIDLDEHPLLHYIRRNGRSGIDPHPLFCSSFYAESNPDITKSDLEPLQHFIERGRDERRDPCPLFSQHYYSATAKLLEGVDLLDHYIRSGGRQLLDPHPLFESKLYAAYNPECLDGEDNPLSHYVRTWARRGMRFPPWGTLLQPRRNQAPESEQIDLIVVSHELTRTGAPAILLKIVEHLAGRKGLQILLLSAQGGTLFDDFCEWTRVIDLAAVRSSKISNELFLKMLMMSFTAGTMPRVVIMNTACISSLIKSFHSAGLPVVTLVHELASIIDFKDFKDIYDHSEFVVYPAMAVRDEAHSNYLLPAGKTEVIPQGLLEPDFGRVDKIGARASLLQEIGAPPTAFIVLGCGSMDLRKGIDVFVKVAAAAITARASEPDRPPSHFVWVGGGPMHRHTPYWYAQEDVKRSRIGANVHFIGPRADTEPYFAGCDAFLLTSRLDPFPCVIHEAMACGKPVIAFENSGGAPEALGEGAGVLVPYGDIAAAAKAVCALADDPASAASCGQRAEEIVRQKYCFSDYVDKILASIEERTGIQLAATKTHHCVNARRDRAIFTVPAPESSSVYRFLEHLVRGLVARGIDAELLFTERQPSRVQLERLPEAPYRFLARGFRKRLPFQELWDRLDRTLQVAAPAIFIHGYDHIASAVAPVVPRKV